MKANNAVSRKMAYQINPTAFAQEKRIHRTPAMFRHAAVVVAAIECRQPAFITPVIHPWYEQVKHVAVRPDATEVLRVGRQKRDLRMLTDEASNSRENRDYRFHMKKRHGHQFKLSLRDRGAFNKIDAIDALEVL